MDALCWTERGPVLDRKSQTAEYYSSKVNRSLDYIEAHFHRNLSIHEIASFAGISAYHFHRIFQAVTGESLYACVIRLRIEWAAARLLTTSISVTEAAYSCGFNDAATFSRAFKKHLGLSPSIWRRQRRKGQDFGKMRKIDHAHTDGSRYNYSNGMNGKRIITPLGVKLKEEPERTIAYVRGQGAFAGDPGFFRDLYSDLILRYGLLSSEKKRIYVIYHNPLGITPDQQLRVSMGFETDKPEDAVSHPDVIRLDEGLYIQACYEPGNREYGGAWSDLYRNILPSRGLEPRDGYAYERYAPDCHDRNRGVTRVDICVPVQKMK